MEMKTNITAEPGRHDLVITRTFDLPVRLVYKAYSEKQFIEQWMGTCVINLVHKSQGSYRFETRHNDQVVFSAHGTIHSIVENESIVRTCEIEHAQTGVQLEFISFESLTETSSRLRIRIAYESEQHRAEQLKLPFAFGLNMAHNRLEELTTNQIENNANKK